MTNLALALYPPSWRARYADEVEALLDESGRSRRDLVSLSARLTHLRRGTWRQGEPQDRSDRDQRDAGAGAHHPPAACGLDLPVHRCAQPARRVWLRRVWLRRVVPREVNRW